MRAQRSDGTVTRQKILESAGELFGERGLAETSSKAIAAQAGVDLASINYHFGSREGLYRAALAEAHKRFIELEDLQQLADSAIRAEEKLEQLFAILMGNMATARHWSTKILVSEMLAPSSHAVIFQDEDILPKQQIIAQILADILEMPADDPALLCCIVTVVAPFILLHLRANSESTIGRKLNAIPSELILGHLRRYAVGGLAAVAEEYHALRSNSAR